MLLNNYWFFFIFRSTYKVLGIFRAHVWCSAFLKNILLAYYMFKLNFNIFILICGEGSLCKFPRYFLTLKYRYVIFIMFYIFFLLLNNYWFLFCIFPSIYMVLGIFRAHVLGSAKKYWYYMFKINFYIFTHIYGEGSICKFSKIFYFFKILICNIYNVLYSSCCWIIIDFCFVYFRAHIWYSALSEHICGARQCLKILILYVYNKFLYFHTHLWWRNANFTRYYIAS